MGTYDKIDFNSKDVWRRYYKKKETAKQIAEVYGCSNVSVLNFIRSQGWEVFGQREAQIRGRFDDKFYAQCRKMYEKGNNVDRIAAHFKTSRNHILKRGRQEGWIKSFSERFAKFGKHWYRNRPVGSESPAAKAKARRLSGYKVLGVGVDLVRYEVTYLSRLFAQIYEIPGKGNSIDHIYSFHDFYYNPKSLEKPCSIKELVHPVNLRWLPRNANASKGSTSDITISELRRRIKQFNRQHGNPFKHPRILALNITNALFKRTDSSVRVNASRIRE